MKPCRKNRKPLAWLALDALEVVHARKLRAHLETCAGCRRHLEEISTVTQSLRAAEAEPDVQAPNSFHRRVLAAVRAEELTPRWRAQLAPGLLNWRVALPLTCGIALLLLALSNFFPHPKANSPSAITAQLVPPGVSRNIDLSPTLSNYELVANQSLEKLDELLNRQASKNLPPAPIYRASGLFPETATE